LRQGARDALATGAAGMPFAAEEFQVWNLTVRADRTATLACDDGNGNIVFTRELEFTDFPLDAIKLYFTDNTILLPSEY